MAKVSMRNLHGFNDSVIVTALKHISRINLVIFLKNTKEVTRAKFLKHFNGPAKTTLLNEIKAQPQLPRSQEANSLLAVINVIDGVVKGQLN